MSDEPSRAQLEWRIEELETENERLRAALKTAPQPVGVSEARGVTTIRNTPSWQDYMEWWEITRRQALAAAEAAADE